MLWLSVSNITNKAFSQEFYIFTASKQVYWKICIFVSVRG